METGGGAEQAPPPYKSVFSLFIVFFAMFASAADWVEIGIFASYYEEYLRKYIVLENGTPSHDTIQRAIALVSPEIMQQIVAKWQEILNGEEGGKS